MSNSQVLISFAERPAVDQIKNWWPDFQFKSSEMFAIWDDAVDWASQRDGYMDGQVGSSVKAIFKNGQRWNLVDFSMLMFDSEKELSVASSEVGDIYVVMTQGTAGCAGFRAYSNGVLRRSIDYIDEEVATEGEPLSVESEIDIAQLYDRELNKLWVRLGHEGLLFDISPVEIECYLFEDHGEIALAKSINESASAPPAKKPWWKIW